jgi:hypothetical protein
MAFGGLKGRVDPGDFAVWAVGIREDAEATGTNVDTKAIGHRLARDNRCDLVVDKIVEHERVLRFPANAQGGMVDAEDDQPGLFPWP